MHTVIIKHKLGKGVGSDSVTAESVKWLGEVELKIN